ncbi:MAG: imidazole glycerol phosphate synthase subunit HisH [Verrucomicrobiales bacterium]
MIAIIDYGMGNLGSIQNMLRRLGFKSVISSSLGEIESADKIILPGVGSFDAGIKNLRTAGFVDLLHRRVTQDGVPFLGICLGMQLLFERSEEGQCGGLGWLKGFVVRFQESSAVKGTRMRIPHMGWNTVESRPGSLLFAGLPMPLRFYFVHSYYFGDLSASGVAGTTEHGSRFVCAIESGNIMATQFHPEKSHKFGLGLLSNFARL